jgi:hypothetical protein
MYVYTSMSQVSCVMLSRDYYYYYYILHYQIY